MMFCYRKVLPSIVFVIILAGLSIASSGDGEFVDNQFVISVNKGIDLKQLDFNNPARSSTGYASIDKIANENGVTNIDPYYSGVLKKQALREVVERMFLVKISEGSDLTAAISAFAQDPAIEFAEPVYISYIDYTPNDPLISSWYHLNNIEAYIAWDFIRGDSTSRAVLGIVDSGVYYDHPDLEPNMWINSQEDINFDGLFTQADINGLDDDGNGYVDDVVGYDIAMNDPYPFEPIPWHGTHVAGCATMATDNGYGGAAIGWAARIMAVKAARDSDPNSIPYGYAGIVYAAENGCNVINLSWGRAGSFSQSEQNIITAAYNSGVVVVAAAGNSNSSAYHWPAAYDHVVSVAATNSSDHKASFSNYGNWVTISAPGDAIISTWDHESYTALSGTSMASPVAAGVVCLIWSAHDRWEVDQVIEQLVNTADNIDDLNPGYEGMLGSGRVNAAAAIGRDIFPRLSVSDIAITITQDDGDGVLNPSESFDLVVTLENAWADANNVSAVLRSDEYFTVTDSISSFGNITGNGGQGNNSGSPFSVDIEDNSFIGNHQFTLAITADGYSTESVFDIYISLEQAGFPIDVPDVIDSPPLVFDFDDDGQKEIVFSANDHKFYSLEFDGDLTSGWPQTVDDSAPAGAAIGDLDGDGDFEIVGSSRSGNTYSWEPNGTVNSGFPYNAGPVMFATPSLADVDGNNDLEIVTAGFGSKKVFVIDHNGSSFPGWPYQGNAVFYNSGALADVDNDDMPEIIFGDFDSKVHVWNSDQSYVQGFPVTLSGPIQSSPAVADIDGDGNLDIIIAAFNGEVYALANDGTVLPGWPVSVGSNIKSSPALADIDRDGRLEIVFGDNGGNLHAYNNNGSSQSGFPVAAEGSITASPVIGDIDGDLYPDIVVGTGDGYIYALDYQGQNLPNFPIRTITGAAIGNSPALADLDGDGDIEIVVGVRTQSQNLEVIDCKTQSSGEDMPWPFYCKDIGRTAYYGDFTTGVDEKSDNLPGVFELIGNYPNPFNANTVIRFSLANPCDADLSIFDIMGRKLKTLASGAHNTGTYDYTWDGTDDSGNSVSSGIYFYKLSYDGKTTAKRMVMIK